MKLLDILQELEKPKQIYAPGGSPSDELNIKNLSPKDKEKLLQQGTLMVPLPQDPTRPETIGAQVINLPKIDQVKRDIIKNKKEFDIFVYSTNPEIKATAKQINKLHNDLFKAMDALDKLLELQKQGRI
jgi:hypothetical protein